MFKNPEKKRLKNPIYGREYEYNKGLRNQKKILGFD
jgi:hypothetical protein